MTKLEELKADYDAAQAAWDDAAEAAYDDAYDDWDAASRAYHAELNKTQEENT